MTTTATFREYHGDIDSDLYVIVNTDYIDNCRLSIVTDTVVRTAHMSRDLAREVGTFLLRATGSDSSWAQRDWNTDPSTLAVDVEDGEATLRIGDGVFVLLIDYEAIDIAQRLIAFGGADLRVDADA